MSMAPHCLAVRRVALREVLDLSSRATDVATRYFALSANVVAAIQAGDLAEAVASWTESDAIAGQYELAPLRWSAKARRAWRAGLEGSLVRAEELIDQAQEYGDAHGVSHAPESARLQRAMLRWQQGRVTETLPAARAAYEAYGAVFPGMALLLARALAECDADHDEARSLVSRLAADRFSSLPTGTFWSSAMVVTAETAYMLDLPEVCSTIRDLLVPFADQVAFTGLWVAAPIAYGIGVAALGCNDPCASQFFEQAAAMADSLQAPVLGARARAYLPANPA